MDKEYIEREAILNKSTYMFDEALGTCKCVLAEDIENHPTADVVEVVRCKDCVLRNTADCAMYYICECGAQYSWETGNDFCSFGKRKGK